uniref:hypothetical protein n=1 Tax=Acetatifactor sp. TaxID=1872090 RepID=UPI00405773F3
MNIITVLCNISLIVLLVMLGIILRHYFDEDIPFDKILGKIEKLIYRVANLLYRMKQNRFLRFVCRTIKSCVLTIFRVLKRFGSFIYKNRVAIGNATVKVANEICKTVTNEDIEECRPNYALMFTGEDIEKVTKMITGHPYDTPVLINWFSSDGVAWYDFQTMRLVKQYEDLDRKALIKMLELTLQKHVIETRGQNAVIYISIATATRFYFGMAFSKYGEKQLAKMRINNEALIPKDSLSPLEEVIDPVPQKVGD